jgi:hypothetical protein
MNHQDSSSAPADGGRVVESTSRETGKTETPTPTLTPQQLIYLVAGRLYAEKHCTSVDMMPWSIDKALKLWNALNDEIRNRGWIDLLEVVQ